jgi:hypothetical protein
MMQGKVVLIQFPFDDLASSKVRPAYCLTSAIGRYHHIIFTLITSRKWLNRNNFISAIGTWAKPCATRRSQVVIYSVYLLRTLSQKTQDNRFPLDNA